MSKCEVAPMIPPIARVVDTLTCCAIKTKYHGPTNTQGSKIIAKSGNGHKLIMKYDHEFDEDRNHDMAAMKLATQLEWTGDWFKGHFNNEYIYVLRDKRKN